jgi:hypothetical protein
MQLFSGAARVGRGVARGGRIFPALLVIILMSATWEPGNLEIRADSPPLLCTMPEPPHHDFGEVAAGQAAGWNFKLLNCGDGILEWTITDDTDWITVAPNIGATTPLEPATITVSINTVGLTPDLRYIGHITLTSKDRSLAGTIVVTVRQPSTPPEDVNQDGVINWEDLAIVVANFGPPPFREPRADVNGDGVVDVLDLAQVAEALYRD